MVAGILAPLLGGASAQLTGLSPVVATPPAPEAPASVTLPIPPEPPALPAPPPPDVPYVATPVVRLTASEVPWQLWHAYSRAVANAPAACHLEISLLEAIGEVESGSLRGRALDDGNRAVPAVLGPVLDGGRFAAIRDTDDGRLDGHRTWDRAVGPMQFIPSTWARWGRDADGDGTADPQDIDDAAASTGAYLCAGGRDLSTSEGLREAVLSYNHSTAYLALVLRWKARFDQAAPGAGIVTLPSAPSQPRPTLVATPAVTVVKPIAPAPQPTPQPAPPATPDPEPAQPPAEEPVQPPAEEPPPEVVPDPPTTTPSPEPEPEPAPPTCVAVPADDPADDPTDDPTGEPTDVPADDPTGASTTGTDPPTNTPADPVESPDTPEANDDTPDTTTPDATTPDPCELDHEEGTVKGEHPNQHASAAPQAPDRPKHD